MGYRKERAKLLVVPEAAIGNFKWKDLFLGGSRGSNPSDGSTRLSQRWEAVQHLGKVSSF